MNNQEAAERGGRSRATDGGTDGRMDGRKPGADRNPPRRCCAEPPAQRKTGILVSIALQNFTSEAETKGKTNQKDRDATPGMGEEEQGALLTAKFSLIFICLESVGTQRGIKQG